MAPMFISSSVVGMHAGQNIPYTIIMYEHNIYIFSIDVCIHYIAYIYNINAYRKLCVCRYPVIITNNQPSAGKPPWEHNSPDSGPILAHWMA